MRIRLARKEDAAALARLHRATIRNVNSKDYPEDIINVWSGRSSAKKFRDSVDRCKRWVALDGEKIIGFCDHSFECELWGLYIHKDYVGKGVGSRLLSCAEKSLKKMGCKKVNIESTISAKKFYQKHGYDVLRKSFKLMDKVKVPIYIMRKDLSV